MHLDYLDQQIPKRWILLLRYWIPFFKTPSSFYFECRSFIDKLKRSGYNYFPWDQLPDLVFIFEKYAFKESEINLSKKIIDIIFTKKQQPITGKLIQQLFDLFNPGYRSLSILNAVFQRLPIKLYNDYFRKLIDKCFRKLNADNCSSRDLNSRNLKWCTRLKEKFLFEDRLCLILSLSDEILTVHQSTIFELVIHECEDKLLIQKCYLNSFANAFVIEKMLEFIFFRNPKIIFSDDFIHTLIKQLLETQNPLLTSRILELDEHARYHFFEKFLTYSPNFQQTSQYFLDLCPEEQWQNLIDQFITSIFNANESEMNDDAFEEKKSARDKRYLLLLTQIQEHNLTYPVNLFQFLALQSLTKKQLDLKQLKKIFEANHGSLEHRKNFSIACQSAVAENSILAIKVFIEANYLVYIRKENTRHDIHRTFYQFFHHELSGKPLNIAELILKKLSEDLQSKYEADLNFLQQLISQLFLIVEDPEIVKFKDERFIEWDRIQRDYSKRNKAPLMQETWRKKARKKTAEIIKFNPVRNNKLSCLSTSPSSSSGNYFML
jgi:hypothetical protein